LRIELDDMLYVVLGEYAEEKVVFVNVLLCAEPIS